MGIPALSILSSVSNSNEQQSDTNHPIPPLAGDAQPTVNAYQSYIPAANANLVDNPYLGGQMDDPLSFNFLDMSTEMYETFTQIEPISVTMNSGFDTF